MPIIGIPYGQASQPLATAGREKPTVLRNHGDSVVSYGSNFLLLVSRTVFPTPPEAGLVNCGADFVLYPGESVVLDPDQDWNIAAYNAGTIAGRTLQVGYFDSDSGPINADDLGVLSHMDTEVTAGLISPSVGAGFPINTPWLDIITGLLTPGPTNAGSRKGRSGIYLSDSNESLTSGTQTLVTFINEGGTLNGAYFSSDLSTFIWVPGGMNIRLSGQVAFSGNSAGSRTGGYALQAGPFGAPGVTPIIGTVAAPNGTVDTVLQLPDIELVTPSTGLSIGLTVKQTSGGALTLAGLGGTYLNVVEIA